MSNFDQYQVVARANINSAFKTEIVLIVGKYGVFYRWEILVDTCDVKSKSGFTSAYEATKDGLAAWAAQIPTLASVASDMMSDVRGETTKSYALSLVTGGVA